MSAEIMTPSAEQITTLRDLFLKKYEKESTDSFHPNDIARVKSTDRWLQLFLEMHDLDMKKSLENLWDTCIWRKEFGTNDIEDNVRVDYLKEGVVFGHNKDVDGKVLLIFRTKLHSKGAKDLNELIRCVVYWIERIHQQTNMDQLTIFFDMQGTSLSSMDTELIKRIIDTFKLYYPNSLNYIIIFEMAWILNAAFKVIKGFIPAKAQAIMKFVNQKTLSQYVDQNNALKCWGGKDDYQFSFIPAEPKTPPPPLNQNSSNNNAQSKVDDSSVLSSTTVVTKEQISTSTSRKAVHFANLTSTKLSLMSDGEEHLTPHEYEMLRIIPNDVIVFCKSDGSDDYCGTVDITCTSKHPITYKIKTTSPDKFRVRPSSGALNPGATVTINVVLQQGYHLSTTSKDKFLVMCSPLPEGLDHSLHVINEIWKNKVMSSPDVQQHRLRCVCSSSQNDMRNNGHLHRCDDAGDATSKSIATNINDLKLSQVTDQVRRIEQELRYSQNLQWITLIALMLISVGIVYVLRQEIIQIQDAHHQSMNTENLCSRNIEL